MSDTTVSNNKVIQDKKFNSFYLIIKILGCLNFINGILLCVIGYLFYFHKLYYSYSNFQFPYSVLYEEGIRCAGLCLLFSGIYFFCISKFKFDTIKTIYINVITAFIIMVLSYGMFIFCVFDITNAMSEFDNYSYWDFPCGSFQWEET